VDFQIGKPAVRINEPSDFSTKNEISGIFATVAFFLEADVIPGC
jgi:hypothetical protein